MGRALGSRYTLGDLLGSGAMGQVYDGVDVDGRRFAFKLLRADLIDDPDFISRFHQERSTLLNLKGAHLVAVRDLVVEGSTAAIVMDLVPGGSLRDLLTESGTLLPAEIARIGAGIADALHDVHLAGYVHRDVKPENVLMDSSTPTRTPRLTDFGISKMTGASKVGRSTLLAGTPNYVAPEIVDGGQITPAADLYSLGILLYELCCGVTPFSGASVFQVLRDHCEKAPGRPDGIPDELWDVIANLLRKKPSARPQSAEHVAAVLAALSERLWNWPVGTRLERPPAAMSFNQGNDNETVLRPQMNPAVSPKRRRRAIAFALTSLILLGGAGGAYAVFSAGEGDSTAGAATSSPTGTRDTADTTTTTSLTTTSSEIRLTSMPNLVGKKAGEARDALPKSMKVEIVDQVDEKTPDGTVLGQEPAAGQPVADTAKLFVARPAVTVYLDALVPTAGRWDTSGDSFVVGMAGKQYLHSLGQSFGTSYCATNTYFAEYNLSKGYRRFVTTAGISDNSEDSALKVQLEVFADGRLISNTPVGFNSVVPLDLDLTGALRLKVQLQVTSGSKTCGASTFALGEAKLLGLAGEVPVSGLPPASTTTAATTTTR
jgi:serine/threonine protein kinase